MRSARLPELNILCISPYFVPVAGAEAFCGAKIILSLMQCGASATVVTCSNLNGAGSRRDNSPVWDALLPNIIDIPQPVARRQQADGLRSLRALSQFETPWYARWVDGVVERAIALHSKRNFDLVYSRSLPMVAHIAGYWCARKLGLPWVANINDPCVLRVDADANFVEGAELGYSARLRARSQSFPVTTGARALSAIENAWHLFWLRRLLLKADLITYPCEALHRFHARLSQMEHAAEIIPHIGYHQLATIASPPSQFRLVHAGSLGVGAKSRRSSHVLLQGLKAFLEQSPGAVANTKLILVGPKDEATEAYLAELGLQNNVEQVGRVSYAESLTHIASASICILVEGKMEEAIYFPSKLADYIACGRPVLALSPRSGMVDDLACRGELIRAEQDDAASVQRALERLYADYCSGKLEQRQPSESLVQRLAPETVAEQFMYACRPLLQRVEC